MMFILSLALDGAQNDTDLQNVNHVTQQLLLVISGTGQAVAQCHQFKLVSFSGNTVKQPRGSRPSNAKC